MRRWFSLARLRALLKKEVIQMRRDRITFAMMLGVPLMQLVLFGFAINTDPKSLPAAPQRAFRPPKPKSCWPKARSLSWSPCPPILASAS
jgi:hypothetical protein